MVRIDIFYGYFYFMRLTDWTFTWFIFKSSCIKCLINDFDLLIGNQKKTSKSRFAHQLLRFSPLLFGWNFGLRIFLYRNILYPSVASWCRLHSFFQSVYRWIVKPQTILKTNEMFLPGRMSFIFNMVRKSLSLIFYWFYWNFIIATHLQ